MAIDKLRLLLHSFPYSVGPALKQSRLKSMMVELPHKMWEARHLQFFTNLDFLLSWISGRPFLEHL